MYKTIFHYTILLVLCLVAEQLIAQDTSREELEYRAFRLTVAPGVGTNGLDSHRFTARFSINLLAGYHGGLNGLEMGPVNVNRQYARGMQLGLVNASGGSVQGVNLAGFLNASHGEMIGLHVAGISNISRDRTRGLHFAGLTTIANGIEGVQVAGIGNFSADYSRGLQIGSLFNFTFRESLGIQISGGINFARTLRGLSVASLLNVSETMQGIQVSSLVNLANTAEGIQFGLYNAAREFSGVPFGLINWYGNGRKNIDAWIADGGFTQIGLKTGTRVYYNIFSFGYNPLITERDVWRIGWTFGSLRNLTEAWERPGRENYFRKSDISIYQHHEGGVTTDMNQIYSYRYMLGRKFTGGFGAYAGPSLNLQVTTRSRANEYTWYSLIETERADRLWRFWVGISAGFQFF